MRLLVGYDGSNVGKEALNIAKSCAEAFQASVEVVTSMVKGSEDDQEKIQQAERGLQYAKSFFDKSGIDCESHLLIRGLSPGEDLVRFAKENDIDFVVVGVKRRSKVGKILMGSTAQYVIIRSPCPVISVK